MLADEPLFVTTFSEREVKLGSSIAEEVATLDECVYSDYVTGKTPDCIAVLKPKDKQYTNPLVPKPFRIAAEVKREKLTNKVNVPSWLLVDLYEKQINADLANEIFEVIKDENTLKEAYVVYAQPVLWMRGEFNSMLDMYEKRKEYIEKLKARHIVSYPVLKHYPGKCINNHQ